MKYTTMRAHSPTNDESKWSNCSLCDMKSKWFYLTVDHKRVCPDCRRNDREDLTVHE